MFSRIGILGGMGPKATLHFMQLLFQSLSKALLPERDQEYPDMTIQMENTIPDRTEAIQDETPQAAQRINRGIASLILSGCDPVVIPCVTAHALVEQRWFDAGVIDLRKCVIDHLDAIYTGQIAVLATEGSYISNVFSPLEDRFNLLYPAPSQQKKLMLMIYGPKGLKAYDTDITACKAYLSDILKDFRHRGSDYFLIGCSDIETFISQQNIDGSFILPMAIMCEEVVGQIQSAVLKK